MPASLTSPPAACVFVCCLQYEPELFPGLIYRMKDPKIVLLIFVSGKVVLTGRRCCFEGDVWCLASCP